MSCCPGSLLLVRAESIFQHLHTSCIPSYPENIFFCLKYFYIYIYIYIRQKCCWFASIWKIKDTSAGLPQRYFLLLTPGITLADVPLMTFPLTFLASFSGYKPWKSIGHSPVWHTEVADQLRVCLHLPPKVLHVLVKQ